MTAEAVKKEYEKDNKFYRALFNFTTAIALWITRVKIHVKGEEKLKDLIGVVMQDGDVILFIDEIHTLVGAGGSSDNNMDAANILKPLLARGDWQVIGATTIEEYRKYTQTQKYVEEVAKEKLGLVNENEIIFKSED